MGDADIVIRPIEEPDLRAYVQVRLEALRDHPAAFGSSYEDCRDLSDEAWLARLKNALDGAHARLFVADAGGSVRSFAAPWVGCYPRATGSVMGLGGRGQSRGVGR